MTSRPEDVSLPTDLPGLEQALADLEERMTAQQDAIKGLMAAEDFANGVCHAAEIHEAKQAHVALRYQRDLCAARMQRLRSEQ